MKKILAGITGTMLLLSIAYSSFAVTCPYDSDYKFALIKALADYYSNPNGSILSPSELSSMLTFYLNRSSVAGDDCTSDIYALIEKADNIPDQVLSGLGRNTAEKCYVCPDGTVCGEQNDKGQTCTCKDVDDDRKSEYCHLSPAVPPKPTCQVCPDGTFCGEKNQKKQACTCKDVNKDNKYEYCSLNPLTPASTTTMPPVTTTLPPSNPTCTPGKTAGCSVCNSDGTAWYDDNTKCPAGQICQNWACIATNKAVKNNIDTTDCNTITGWICDPNNPNTQYWVEFYLDETTNAGYLGWSGMATTNRPDIAKQCGGSPNHGFTFTIPATTQGGRPVKDGKTHTIHLAAKDSNGQGWIILTGSPKTITCGPGPNPTTTMPPVTTTLPPSYPVCTPGKTAGCSVCNSDGTAWYDDNTKCPTGQTCQNWACIAADKAVKNYIDTTDCNTITGWICDPNNPNTQYWLEFYLDETTSAGYLGWSGMATINRPDIVNQCGGSPAHGFTFTIPATTQGGRPVKDGKTHQIHMAGHAQKGDWIILTGSPKTITCSSTPAGTIIVTTQTDGVTEKSIGANEGGEKFSINDLNDIGITNYRIWASGLRHPWNDEDGVWGSPTIAQIKANPNLIDWSLWDAAIKNKGWRNSNQNLYDMLTALKQNGITPVLSLLNYWKDVPGLTPPTTDADYNEVWENVFAMVYDINVRNDLNVDDWEVDNEPDLGWPGTRSQYVKFVQETHDAIKYVYDTYLPGRSFRLYDPADSGWANAWVSDAINSNGNIVDVIDFHHYGSSTVGDASTIRGWLAQSGHSDKELYLSEWGTYTGGYENSNNAITYAQNLMEHSLVSGSYIDNSAIFSLYDWGKAGQSGYMPGLITGAGGVKTPSYYAFRMVTRAFQGAKTKYVLKNAPSGQGLTLAATKGGRLYLTVLNSGSTTQTLSFDVSAHKKTGTITLRKFSSTKNDEVIGNPSLNNGIVSFTSEPGTITQAVI